MPDLARSWEIVSRSDAGNTPQHRSLADFERLYSGVGADNYIWYQGRFSERVFAIFAIEGLDFLRKVKDAFPACERDAHVRRVPRAAREDSTWVQGMGEIGRIKSLTQLPIIKTMAVIWLESSSA